jgi:hypothetical protein
METVSELAKQPIKKSTKARVLSFWRFSCWRFDAEEPSFTQLRKKRVAFGGKGSEARLRREPS